MIIERGRRFRFINHKPYSQVEVRNLNRKEKKLKIYKN